MHHEAPAAADASYRAGDLLIEQPWSRATPGGAKVAGGYVRITNKGTTPDRLVGGSFAAAGRMEVHEMSVTDGIMRMKPVEGGVAIPPGATVELKPGGYHAMFLDLQHPLKQGDTVQGTLQFEKAGSVPVTYRVLGMGAQSSGMAH
jgi:copper(I)-binding protein